MKNQIFVGFMVNSDIPKETVLKQDDTNDRDDLEHNF